MDTAKLGIVGSKVNGSPQKTTPIAEVIKWVDAQANKADMGQSSARVRATALQQMLEQVAVNDGELDDAQWVYDNMDRLRERWARRNPGAMNNTVLTYASRAKATIGNYLEWAAAPDKYDPRKAKPRTEKKPESAKAKKQAAEPTVAHVPTVPPVQPAAPQAETRTFPLGDPRGSIVFQLPPGGVRSDDVRKFAVHLFTLASDFNITDQHQSELFGMLIRSKLPPKPVADNGIHHE